MFFFLVYSYLQCAPHTCAVCRATDSCTRINIIIIGLAFLNVLNIRFCGGEKKKVRFQIITRFSCFVLNFGNRVPSKRRYHFDKRQKRLKLIYQYFFFTRVENTIIEFEDRLKIARRLVVLFIGVDYFDFGRILRYQIQRQRNTFTAPNGIAPD